jgi:hypothetical protein
MNLEQLSRGQALLERTAMHIRNTKREALASNDVKEVWLLSEVLETVKQLQRTAKADFLGARKELLLHRIEEHPQIESDYDAIAA